MHLDHLFVVPIGNTSFGSDIDHEDGFFSADEIFKVGFFAVNCCGFEIEEFLASSG
jgi:hypothetical protein